MFLIYFILELNVNFLKFLFNLVKIFVYFYDFIIVDIFMYVFYRILFLIIKFGVILKIEEKCNKMKWSF